MPMTESKITVCFLNGDEVQYDGCATLCELKARIAHSFGRFIPEIVVLSEEGGEPLGGLEEEGAEVPCSKVFAVMNDVDYDSELWKQAIYLHARARDLAGLHRALVVIDENADGDLPFFGREAVTEVFMEGMPYEGMMTDACIDTLLRAGVDPHQVNMDGRTCLMFAAQYCDVDTVDRLLQSGAQVDDEDEGGETSLMLASRRGDVVGVVDRLLLAGADVEHEDDHGFTPLSVASSEGHCDVLERLLAAGARVDHADFEGMTSLFEAQYYGHEKAVELLLKAGAEMSPDFEFLRNTMEKLHFFDKLVQ